MKTIVLFFLLLSVNLFYGQNLGGYYVTNENDTIKCKFDVQTNTFDSLIFYQTSVQKKVKIILSNGEKLKYKPLEIKSFFIEKTKSGNYKFVSLDIDPDYFYQEILIGRISIFYNYTYNMQSGGLPIRRTYFLKDTEFSSRETAFFNFRNWFGKFIEDFPELYQKWMDSDNYYKKNDVYEVIKIYNEHFNNKK